MMFVENLDMEQLWSLVDLLGNLLELVHQYTTEFIYLTLCVSLILMCSKMHNSD